MTRSRSIVVLPALATLALAAGCTIDNRMLMPRPLGTGQGGAAGHGGGSGGASGSRGSAGAVGAAGAAGAGPAAILLGNFENDTALPQDARFANYQYYAYNPTTLPPGAFETSPLVSPGYNSNFGLGLNWEVIDVADGVPNYPGVGVRTVVNTGFVDLSAYNRIVFAQQYLHSGSCQALQTLTIVIACDELNTSYVGAVPVSSTWTNSSLAFSSLAEPTFLPPSGHTLAECLAVANRVDFQAQANLVDGDCASGSLSLDNIEIRATPPNLDAGASAGISISPDGSGTFDGTNAAGVVGAWGSTGDYYAADGTAGGGTCPQDGFPKAQCSTINAPMPGTPFMPDPTGRGMCTSGTAAQVIPGDGGQPAYSFIWGNFVFFDLNHPPSPDAGVDAGAGPMVYDAPAHGVTGFAFDLDGSVNGLRVEFPTDATWTNAAYWEGATANVSPVSGPGHYEIRWADVGGPSYLAAPPPFDPTKLESIRFHVISAAAAATPYSYCIKNTVLLTGP